MNNICSDEIYLMHTLFMQCLLFKMLPAATELMESFISIIIFTIILF